MANQNAPHTIVHHICTARIDDKGYGCQLRACPSRAQVMVAFIILRYGVRVVTLCDQCAKELLSALSGRAGGLYIDRPIRTGKSDARMNKQTQNTYHPVRGARMVIP